MTPEERGDVPDETAAEQFEALRRALRHVVVQVWEEIRRLLKGSPRPPRELSVSYTDKTGRRHCRTCDRDGHRRRHQAKERLSP